MNSPLDKSTAQNCKATYLDISPERLNGMSPSELADAMEEALNSMTEDTYDPEVIAAYLDALDRKSPLPEQPTAEEAYRDFQHRIEPLSTVSAKQNTPTTAKHLGGFRRTLRVGLVAALLVSCLFGSMVVAQAAGLDVFGAMARWTESVFSFGALAAGEEVNNPSDTSRTSAHSSSQTIKKEVPEEYKELQAALAERGLPLQIPEVPDGFNVVDSTLYTDPDTGNIQFTIGYLNDNDYIIFDITQNSGHPTTIYEKDDNDVTLYEYNGVTHYIFSNNESYVAAWIINGLEYSLSTTSKSISLTDLVQSTYEE